ncbi:MAG: biopolymer transporter ExbD [Pirellulaceae bacterium]
MAFQVTCPQCQSVHAAGPQLLGRRVKCPRCGGAIDVPANPNGGPAASANPAAGGNGSAGNAADNKSRFKQPATPATPATPAAGSASAAAAYAAAKADEHAHHMGSSEAVSVAALEHPDADDDSSVGFGNKDQTDNAEMDMTPMVDVTFLLLIFFMVTASFSMQKTMQLPRSKTDAPSTQAIPQDPEEESESITVVVSSYNTYTVETSYGFDEAPSEQELLIKLRDAVAGSSTPPTKLVVKAHIDSTHQKVVAALDAGVEVGMEQLQYVTITEDE